MITIVKCLIGFSVALMFAVGAFADYAKMSDVTQVCDANAQYEIKKSARFISLSDEIMTKATTSEIADKALPYDRQQLDAWLMQDSASVNVTRAGYELQLKHAGDIANRTVKSIDLQRILETATLAPATYTESDVDTAQQILAVVERSRLAYGTAGFFGGLTAPYTCAKYFDVGCATGVAHIFSRMNPRSVNDTSTALYSIIEKLELDPSLVQGAAVFGLKILKRMQEPAPDLAGLHLFDEIKQAYISVGFTEAHAEEKTWTLLAFYGTRGPSMTRLALLAAPHNLPLFLSLYIFSAALGTLDHLTVATGHPYSYPARVETHCYYGRPYHFWLSAYLAHELKTSGYPTRSAFIATHLAGKLYEFGAETIDRKPLEIYANKPFTDPVISLQKNVAFNDGGAHWGSVRDTDKLSLNLDRSLMKIMNASVPLTEAAQKKAADKWTLYRYGLFERLVAPDAALDTY